MGLRDIGGFNRALSKIGVAVGSESELSGGVYSEGEVLSSFYIFRGWCGGIEFYISGDLIWRGEAY